MLDDEAITLAATISYNGKPFCGFARQPGQLTIQGDIEYALSLLFRRDVTCVCAGRTDAGVHARNQVISFDIGESELRGRSLFELCRSMNALTDDGIIVKDLCRKPLGFSARFDARYRHYRYFLCIQDLPSLFLEGFSWHTSRLDIEAMEEGSEYLIGEHDFKSFCKSISAVGKPTCRNVMEIAFESRRIMDEDFLTIDVIGNAFLHSMVRTMVGSLVMVGKGKRDPVWIEEILAARERSAAGECAPAKGLVLWDVSYD